MANFTFTRNDTLPDSAAKADFYNLIDTATGQVTNIDNSDIASAAAIADTKLATISTAGKVNGSAITSGNISTTGYITTTGDVSCDNLTSTGGVLLEESSAPVTAEDQGGLYTKYDNESEQTELFFREENSGDELQITKNGGLKVLGTKSAKSINTNYQADTDGLLIFICGASTAGGDITASILSDASATPSTVLAQFSVGQSTPDYPKTLIAPIKYGDYYKAYASGSVASSTIYFMPFSS